MSIVPASTHRQRLKRGFRHRRTDETKRLRLYYASDVHGSDLCWRKFLNAARFYGADQLVMGGDLAGKAMVPVVMRDGTHEATVMGQARSAASALELAELEAGIRANGFYPVQMSQTQLERIERDPKLAAEAFEQAMTDELARWVELADERLAVGDTRAYVIAGNDDPWRIDAVLAGARCVVACDERIERIAGHELLSFSHANRTPWNSPRELDEEDLYTRLRALADQLENPARTIFNLHVPPYDSGLDTACELDDELCPVMKGGRPHEIPVGSTAVRQIIEEVQPALSLHGHIHESRAVATIGRTVAINPGSDYGSGLIHGCVVDIRGEQVERRMLVSG